MIFAPLLHTDQLTDETVVESANLRVTFKTKTVRDNSREQATLKDVSMRNCLCLLEGRMG